MWGKDEPAKPTGGRHQNGYKATIEAQPIHPVKPVVPVDSAPFAIDPRAPFWRRLLFLHVDPLIARGRRQRLEPEDCLLLPELETSRLYT